jgi:hypothetical protein
LPPEPFVSLGKSGRRPALPGTIEVALSAIFPEKVKILLNP